MIRNIVATFALCFLAAVGFAQQQQPITLPTTKGQFKLEKLAEGIYCAVRTELPNLMVNANSTFIITDNDVVVVDTGLTPSYARELVAEIKKLTPKPVAYVVNTHWHDDHIMGNQIFRDAFPDAQFIAQESMGEYLPTTGLANRKKMFDGAPPVIQRLRESIASGKSLSGAELSSEEKASYATSVAMAEQYMAEVPGTHVILPTLLFKDKLTLERGKRTIEILHLGRGHTAADTIVYVPAEKILIAGDLLIAPVPLIGSDQSYVGDWSETLRKLLAINASIIVPGHGPVMHDDSYARIMQAMFASIDEQTRAAVLRGESLDEARKSVELREFRKKLAGDDKVLNLLFGSYVAAPGVAAAYREAKANTGAPSKK